MKWKIVNCLSIVDWADVANSILWDVILVRLSFACYLFMASISPGLLLFGGVQITSWPWTRRKKLLSWDLLAFSHSEHSVSSNRAKLVGWQRKVFGQHRPSKMWRVLTLRTSPLNYSLSNSSGIWFYFINLIYLFYISLFYKCIIY